MLKQIYRFLNPKFQNLFLEYKVNFKPRYGYGLPPHQELYKIINFHREEYKKYLLKALTLKERFYSIPKIPKNSLEPHWNNGYLPGLDIIALYTIISEHKPSKYIEIGSGNSTKVAYKAIKELNLPTEIISIDPQPRTEISNIANKIIKEPFENIDHSFIINELKSNDIIFVDNSHRILPNSDAMVFFLEVLPKLNKGVIVHIHDIYLPYDYPQFMCDRFYSEQYGLAIYLLSAHQRYVPILPNYFVSEDKELSEIIKPIWEHENLNNVERHGGSFWLRIED